MVLKTFIYIYIYAFLILSISNWQCVLLVDQDIKGKQVCGEPKQDKWLSPSYAVAKSQF